MKATIGIVTWRNTLRISGLAAMLYLIFTRAHPDPTALLACGAMMGLPSFVSIDGAGEDKKKKDGR